MTKTYAFVSTDPSVTPKPGKSKAIRSYCMQGKNKREGSRRSKQEKNRKTLAEDKDHSVVTVVAPSDAQLALVRFASQVESDARALLIKAYAYNTTNTSQPPLTRCVDFNRVDLKEPQWLFSDAAFLHSLLCSSYAATDLATSASSSPSGNRVVAHMGKALAFLAKKMGDENAAESEPVLYAVINLTVLAVVYDDWNAAMAHFAGLQRIIQLRGGMDFLYKRPKLHEKIDRLDLTRSLSLGTSLLFPPATISWEPLVKLQFAPLSLYCLPNSWDSRLVTLFLDFQHLALRINIHVAKHASYKAGCFQPLLNTLQSRLMYLAGRLASPIEELVRLTLLAYMTTSFELSSKGVEYPWLSVQLETIFMRSFELLQEDVVLRTWVLMVASISVGTGKAWVKKEWATGQKIDDWSGIKSLLMSVVWIECVHDQAGSRELRLLRGA